MPFRLDTSDADENVVNPLAIGGANSFDCNSAGAGRFRAIFIRVFTYRKFTCQTVETATYFLRQLFQCTVKNKKVKSKVRCDE